MDSTPTPIGLARSRVYGSDALGDSGPDARRRRRWRAPLHAQLPYTGAEVVWAARHEMARTVEDVLARRTRALFLNARAAAAMAPEVARLMAGELGWDADEDFGRGRSVHRPRARLPGVEQGHRRRG